MRKTEWKGQNCPPLYTERINGGMKQITVFVGCNQSHSDDGAEEWTATAVTLPVGVNDYASIVSAIINSKYSNDQMQAIMFNRGDGREDHEEEYQEMQAWRSEAKRIAKIVVSSIVDVAKKTDSDS